MAGNILEIDQNLFLILNHLPHNFIFNAFFSFLSVLGNWGILWLIIVSILFAWEEIKDKKGFYALIIAIILSAAVSDFFLKNIIQRPRPEFFLNDTIIIADNRQNFSFPSGHTTIAFAAAYILSKEHKKWRAAYFLIAFLIAFSRIYLGKHYPLDVVYGGVLGMIIGYLSLKIVVHSVIASRQAKQSHYNRKKTK